MTAAQFSAPPRARSESRQAGVVHIRHRHETHFTVVGHHLAQHPTLSAVAIGIAVHIQSLPDGASVGVKHLCSRFPEGEITIARALRELEAAGYLQRRRERTESGRIVSRTTFRENPRVPAEPLQPERPSVGPRLIPGPRARKSVSVPPPAPVPTPVPMPAPRQAARETAREPERPERPAAGPATGPRLPEPGDDTVVPLHGRTAADLLASLRLRDPRLLLSEQDVRRLVPGVCTWLDRGIAPGQITRTLTGSLPLGPIQRPARLLAYRLAEWLPPPLPAAPVASPRLPGPERPAPLRTCDGCERAFRSPVPGRCRDCRNDGA